MTRILAAFLCFLSLSASAQLKPSVITTSGTALLIPEGIAVHPKTGIVYVSSIQEKKIIAIEKDGKHRDLFASGEFDFLEGLGMKVDEKNNRLFVVSNQKQGRQHISRIHSVDLSTGKAKMLYTQQDTVMHLFNDLVIDESGKLWITDTYYSAVYRFDPAIGNMELFVKNKLLDYPNGIAKGKNNQLYIATYRNGLMKLDMQSKELKALTGFRDSTMAYALDGLVYFNNSLIGIFNTGNDRSRNTVVQYDLDANGNAITAERILDRGHPAFYEPTTAALVGNKLYVLANSHLASYNANKQSVKGVENKLTDVAVVIYELSSGK